jgi:hypothetical protein
MSMKGREESSAWLITVRDVEDADICYCAAAICRQSTTVVEIEIVQSTRHAKTSNNPDDFPAVVTSFELLRNEQPPQLGRRAHTRLDFDPPMLTLVEIETLIKRQNVGSAFMYLGYEPQHQRSVWQFAKSGSRLRSPASTEPSFGCGGVLLSAFLEP